MRVPPARIAAGPGADITGSLLREGHHAMRSKATARPLGPRTKTCRTCKTPTPTGRLVGGDCPTCAGLVALPLRGEGGRFLPGLTDRPTGGAR